MDIKVKIKNNELFKIAQRYLFDLKIPWTDNGYEVLQNYYGYFYIVPRSLIKNHRIEINYHSRFDDCKWVLYFSRESDDCIEIGYDELENVPSLLEADKMGLV